MLLEDFLLQRWKVILHILDAIIVHLLDYWPELFFTLQNIILYTISSITYGLTVTVNKQPYNAAYPLMHQYLYSRITEHNLIFYNFDMLILGYISLISLMLTHPEYFYKYEILKK